MGKKSGKAPENTTKKYAEDPFLLFAEGVMVGPSRAIENMEARGQQQLVTSETLPTRGSHDPQWKKMGVVFGDKVSGDDLFRYVTLPPGWKKRGTGHSMHNELMDEKGRVRARFFYKAAFYDRDAFINLSRRFEATYEPDGGWEAPRENGAFGIVKDDSKEIWRSDKSFQGETEEEAEARHQHFCQKAKTMTPEEIQKLRDRGDLGYMRKSRSDLAQRAAEDYLNEHYPDWMNPTAYWD